MLIIGAGMAGLLAANMLRRFKPVVLEKNATLPFNHSAVLRFRNEGVSRATGIPFRKVMVHKAMMTSEGEIVTNTNLKYSNMYANKVTDSIISRSIMKLDPVERFIAPDDFLQHMANSVDVKYGVDITQMANSLEEPIISTIPMPALMDLMCWPAEDRPAFIAKKIWVLTAEISKPEVDVFQTIYYPDWNDILYRASITGNKLILEYVDKGYEWSYANLESEAKRVLENFGINDPQVTSVLLKCQPLGKIVPIANALRKNFIFEMSSRCHIYSLGRYATWRQILLDDLVNDVHFIEEFISQRDLYSAKKLLLK